MGDVVLGEVLREKKLLGAREVALDFWVVPSAGVAPTAVVQAAAALRRVGLSTDYVLNVGRLASQKTSAQLGTAAKSGAAHALLLLPDGRNEIKDLRREAAPGFADLPRLWKAGSAEAYLQDSPRGVHDAIADILRRKRERHAGDADRP
jgi:hypothetical protein